MLLTDKKRSMKKLSFFIAMLLLFSNAMFAQVAINSDNSAPDNSSMLDVKSTTKGVLVPRMAGTQRDAISNPAKGLLIFCTDNNAYYSNTGTPSSPLWLMVSSQWITNGSTIYYNLGNVGIGNTNPTYKLDVSGTGRFAYGVTGNHTTPYMAAVIGNSSAADHDYGIYGISNTSTGIAIYGYANSGLAGYFSGNVTSTGTIQAGNIKYNNGTNLLHTIGESYGGGIVFYVYDGGQHGLIAATSDQNTGISWYGGSYTDTRARANGVGAGLKNTAIIIANQGPVYGDGFAATMCSDYSVTVNGVTYGDWYLPSETELYLLYLQRSVVGGFAAAGYWSSTEISSTSAWVQYFDDGNQFYYPKEYTYHVRAIRAF